MSRRAAAVREPVPPRHHQAPRLQHHQDELVHRGAEHHGRRHAAPAGVLLRPDQVPLPLRGVGFRVHADGVHHLRLRQRRVPAQRRLLRLFHDDVGNSSA